VYSQPIARSRDPDDANRATLRDMRSPRAEIVSVLALVAVPGCRQVFGLPDPVVTKVDAPLHRDGRRDGGDTLCLGVTFTACAPEPTAPLALATEAIDTDRSPRCAVGTDSNACVIAATSLVVTGTLTVTGGKPLVLLASDHVDVTGRVSLAGPRAIDLWVIAGTRISVDGVLEAGGQVGLDAPTVATAPTAGVHAHAASAR
jgi:hypothetical protein